MKDEKYVSQFKTLGLEIKPLPANYSPDQFGRSLMRDFQQKPAISYTDGTDYTGEKKRNLKNGVTQ